MKIIKKIVSVICLTALLVGCVPPSGTPGAGSGTDTSTVTVNLNDITTAKSTRVLSANFTAYKFADSHVGIWERATGDIYNLPGVVFEEMRVDGVNLYYLDNIKHQLFRVFLGTPRFQSFAVSQDNASVWSSMNTNNSPFKFLGFNQIGQSNSYPSHSFIFLQNSKIAALGGPSGGPRVELFEEGYQEFDCQNSNLFSNVGGGLSGGVMQFVDKALYQIRIVNSPNCNLPGVEGCGDALVKLEIDTNNNCGSTVVIQQLNSNSKFTGNNQIQSRTNYQLNIVNRYVLHPSGFLHTQDNGQGGVTMSWTDLNLSSVPVNNSNAVMIDGNKVYWMSGNNILYQNLTSGSQATLFYTHSKSISSFNVTNSQITEVK